MRNEVIRAESQVMLELGLTVTEAEGDTVRLAGEDNQRSRGQTVYIQMVQG